MKFKLTIFFIIIIALVVRLFCGIYIHDEYKEQNLFIKHKPSWKWKFYSPSGMSELKFEEMTEEQKAEQKYWDEFIVGKQAL